MTSPFSNHIKSEKVIARLSSDVLFEIAQERERQDQQWGGPEHDDEHEDADWLCFISKQVENASVDTHRERLVKIAALAIAALESLDRRRPSKRVDP